jgi:type I restriction enzyme M protein
VEVLDGAGKPVHGKTLLANLRATYEVEPTANPASAKPVAASPQGVARSAVPSATSEPVITSTLETATGGLTLAELESRLWAAANSLRGPVDPADFKSYVFPLLFFKWVSDTWDLDHAAAVADYGTDIPPQAEADYHRFKVPEGCHWSDLQKVSINVGVALQNILDRLAEANPANLAGIFGDVAWGNKERLPEPSLLNLIDSFDRMKLNREVMPNDMLGAAYEYLLRQFADASGQKAGEFFTPRAVVRLLIRILQPQPGEAVYDPACGSGGMLVETINEVAEAGGDTRTLRLYGQEINLTTAAIARMNLFLHDLEDFRIVRGDTLRDPRFLDRSGLRKYDIVVANPPFSQKNWGADTWAQDPYGRASCGVPPAGAADLAWVQHMVGSMRSDTGRVGVVMPHGVLSRGGVEKAIRQCLIEQDMLEAVIGLPPNLFYSTQIRACLLIFQAGKTDARKGSVLFVDGSSCFEKGRNQNQLRSQDIDTIVAAYRDGTSGAKTVAGRLVQHHEVKENGWDLNIGRYLITEAIEGMTVETALNQLAKAQAALQEANDRLSECLRAAGYA